MEVYLNPFTWASRIPDKRFWTMFGLMYKSCRSTKNQDVIILPDSRTLYEISPKTAFDKKQIYLNDNNIWCFKHQQLFYIQFSNCSPGFAGDVKIPWFISTNVFNSQNLQIQAKLLYIEKICLRALTRNVLQYVARKFLLIVILYFTNSST